MIHTLYPIWLVTVCAATGIFLTWLMYRKSTFLKNRKILSFPALLLIILRFSSITLLCFFLLLPFVKKHYKKIEKPYIIIAADNSASVVLNKDSAYLRKYLKKDLDFLTQKLNKKFKVVHYTFGHKVKESNNLSFDEKRTDFSTLFNRLYEDTYNSNPGAIIVVSDGIYNYGNDPLLTPVNLTCPLYTIAIGDTTPFRDLLIKNIVHNNISFKGNKFPVKIFVNARRCKGEKVKINITHGGKTIFNQDYTITNDPDFQEIETFLEAIEPGIQKYTVSVSFLKNEITHLNNIRDFYIEILENKNKILLIANSPHPDISAIRSTFKESGNFEVDLYYASETESNTSVLEKNLSDQTVAILHQLPAENQPLAKTLDFLSKRNIPILYILGSQSSVTLFNRLNTGLQILQNRRIFENAQAVINENFNYFNIENLKSELITEFPPLSVYYGNYKITGENQVIFNQKIGRVNTDYPLFILFRNADKRNGVICGEGIWRWRMTENKLTGKSDVFNEILRKTILFLSLKEDRRTFKLNQSSYTFYEDEPIEIFAELLNRNFEKQKNAEIILNVKNAENQNFQYRFQEVDEGYRANLGYLPAGQYMLNAETNIDGVKHQATAILIIKKTELEQLELTANHKLLYALATGNGGKMYYLSETEQLAKEILSRDDIKPMTFFNYETHDLIDSKWIMFLIVLLLSVEWFIRKYSGSY